MKNSVAFRALQAKRQAESAATKTLLVKRLNKDGTVSRAKFHPMEYQLNGFTAEQAVEAEARRQELERLNPGSKYVVVGA